jgi:enoyl-[acyl-carrier-protein] reductase (NADH)
MGQIDVFFHSIGWFKKREMNNYFLEWMKGQDQNQARREMEQERGT